MEVIEHHRRLPGEPGAAPLATLERLLCAPEVAWLAGGCAALVTLFGWRGDWALAREALLASQLGLLGLLLLHARRQRQASREARLRRTEVEARTSWLDAVSGLSPDAVLVFERDAEGVLRLVFTNPAFSELFGLRPEELLGLSEPAADEWLAGLARDDSPMPPLQPGEATMQLTGPPARVLRRRAREDARQRVYYFRDVTHETAVEQLKNEFLTTAAHELRTPLASVYGFSELLVMNRLAEPRRIQVTEVVHRQAGVLKHLVDQLLDLARIDARGAADFHPEHCDLRTLAETAVESFLRPDEPSRIQLSLDELPLQVLADPAKLQQALVNAISNALKYSAAPSPVQVFAMQVQRQGQPWVAVSVQDQGIGMSPEQLARASERFYRADPSGHILGAGLGLAIVQEIIQHHRGELSLSSVPGVGTTLTMALPLALAPDTAPALTS